MWTTVLELLATLGSGKKMTLKKGVSDFNIKTLDHEMNHLET